MLIKHKRNNNRTTRSKDKSYTLEVKSRIYFFFKCYFKLLILLKKKKNILYLLNIHD